jgi:hypothetical protein
MGIALKDSANVALWVDGAFDMLLTSDLAKIEVRFTGSGDLLERFRIASKVSRHERELAEQ